MIGGLRMLNCADTPSKAIKLMEQKKDFYVTENKQDKYDFYGKIVNSLDVRDSEGKELESVEKSINIGLPNVKLDVNRLFQQLGGLFKCASFFGGKLIMKLSKTYKDKNMEKMVELSNYYKISLLYDRRILFEYME
jgi:hypothetical protein